jgi:hypothetical protein
LVEAPAEIARLVEDCHGEEASTDSRDPQPVSRRGEIRLGYGPRLAAAERERNVGGGGLRGPRVVMEKPGLRGPHVSGAWSRAVGSWAAGEREFGPG